MVSGGFDPIHPGHVRLFEEAKRLGDKLIVVINNDHWIRAKKGHGFMSAKDRAEVISSFRYVDKVVIFDNDIELIEQIRKFDPDIFVVGSDYKDKKVIGAEYARQLIYFDKIGGYSSSRIIESKTNNS